MCPKLEIDAKDYVDQKVGDLDDRTDLKINALTTAVTKSERLLEIRLEGMNEFREQLKDQASRFVTRDEMELKIKEQNSTLKGLIGGLIIALLILAAQIFFR